MSIFSYASINLLNPSGFFTYQVQRSKILHGVRFAFSVLRRTESDFCYTHHEQNGLYNRGGKCLLRETDGFRI